MGIETTRGQRQGGYVYPEYATQEVKVNGQAALFVQGTWTQAAPGVLRWNMDADATALSWQADGYTYMVGSSGLGLSQQDIIRVAESLAQE